MDVCFGSAGRDEARQGQRGPAGLASGGLCHSPPCSIHPPPLIYVLRSMFDSNFVSMLECARDWPNGTNSKHSSSSRPRPRPRSRRRRRRRCRRRLLRHLGLLTPSAGVHRGKGGGGGPAAHNRLNGGRPAGSADGEWWLGSTPSTASWRSKLSARIVMHGAVDPFQLPPACRCAVGAHCCLPGDVPRQRVE